MTLYDIYCNIQTLRGNPIYSSVQEHQIIFTIILQFGQDKSNSGIQKGIYRIGVYLPKDTMQHTYICKHVLKGPFGRFNRKSLANQAINRVL